MTPFTLYMLMKTDYLTTLSRIILARPTQSAITVKSLGDDLVMFSSLASRTAAMMDAAITKVDANRSLTLRSSS